MRSALESVDGIGKIDIHQGDPDFTVHYDSKKVKPAAIVDALHKGGRPGAKLKS